MNMLRQLKIHRKLFINYTSTSFSKRKISSLTANENKAIIIVDDDNTKRINVTLQYVNEELKINREFNFERNPNEQSSNFLSKISEKINDYICYKLKKKKFAHLSFKHIEVDIVLRETGEISKVDDRTNREVFINSDEYCLKVDNVKYLLDVNPPLLTALELPKSCMSGFLIYPSKLRGFNFCKKNIVLKWFRSKEKMKSYTNRKGRNSSWEEIGDSYCHLLSTDDVSKLIKVIGTPFEGSQIGSPLECTSNTLVVQGPGPCPFEMRHKFTMNILDSNFLRVVSYNILADFYADSDYSRSTLFPTCPPEALEINYRKQLLIKEILGYNADIICLQEVDKVVFEEDFQPVFSHLGFEGTFKAKQSTSEGLATFYRQSKLRLKTTKCFTLNKDVLMSESSLKDIWEQLKLNLLLHAAFSKQRAFLQVNVFTTVGTPSQILVCGTTHLYSAPKCDHIRLLQAILSITLLRNVMEVQKSENPGTNVTFVFCGDFNSNPESAVYRLMTSKKVDEHDADWRSKRGEEVESVSFSHDFHLGSACGTPKYTNYTKTFQECLDYIFYQTDKFSVQQVVPLPSHEEVTENEALPSVTFPSDHIAIVADLKWRK